VSERRGPWIELLVALVLLGLCGALGSRLQVTGDLARLLPKEGELAEAVAMVEHFEIADSVLLEVDGSDATRAELADATRELGERLAQEPAFAEVRYEVQVQDGVALQQAVSPHAVELLDADTLAERLSPEGMQRALGERLIQLMGPSGALVERQLRDDPLDLSGLVLDQLRQAGPFEVQVEAGLLLDRSGTRSVILARPATSSLEGGTDSVAALLDEHAAATALPVRWMGGHRHAADAESLLRGDGQRAGMVGGVLLIAVLLLGFRSVRPLLGALGPVTMAGAAVFAAAGLRSPVHGISLAFTAALLGLALDYWIHLYVAASERGGDTFADRLAGARSALWALRMPLALGAGSTLGACLLLLTSQYPVVQDLGAMGGAATAGALLGTVLLGPVAIAVVGATPTRGWALPELPPWLRAIGLVVGLGLLVSGLGSRFDGDPRNLSPLRPETRALEAELGARYGGFGRGGMVVVDGPDLDTVLDRTERVQRALEALPGVRVVGPAGVLPGAESRAARRALLPPVDELQLRLDGAATAAGFTPLAVEGAAARMHAVADAPLGPESWDDTALADVSRTHLRYDDGRVQAMVALVLPDVSVAEQAQAVVQVADPDAHMVLPSLLSAVGAQEIVRELLRLGGLALAGVVLALGIRYRAPRPVVAALIPVLAALAGATGVMRLLGVQWNAISACGMVLVVGLGLDYGVFLAEARGKAHAVRAVGLSAATTLAGFGVLALARTDTLRGVGIAISSGLLAALVAGVLFTPRLARGEAVLSDRAQRVFGRLAWVVAVLFTLDVLAQQVFFLPMPDAGTAPTYTLEEPSPGDRRFGPHRLLHAEGIWSEYTVGPAYERGYAAAHMAPDLRARLEEQTIVSFRTHVPSVIGRYLITRGTGVAAFRLDKTFQPDQLDVIRGSIDASADPFALMGPPYTRKVYYHAIHDVGQAVVDSPFVVGCTGFMAGPGATADGHWILARNFDFDGGPIFDRDKVVSFVVPEHGLAYASVSFSGFVGAVSGMNEAHLAVAINAGGSDDPPQRGTPMTLIIQEILNTATTLEEAEAVLLERRGFVSENVLVVEGQTGRAALFEVSPKRLGRIDVDQSLGVANHYRTDVFADDGANASRMTEITTVYRQDRMDELLAEHHGDIDLDVAVSMLRDRKGPGGVELPAGHRWAIDADIATHSVAMDVTEGVIWVSRYPNTAGGYVAYRLDEGLAGELNPVEVVPAQDVARTLAIHQGRALLTETRWEDPEVREAAARQALELMPGHPEPMKVLAEALEAQGQHDQAVEWAERALAFPAEYAAQERALKELVGQ
jgi:predicted exporter